MSQADDAFLERFWSEIAELPTVEQYEAIIARREELVPHVRLAQTFRDQGDEFMVNYRLITEVTPTFADYDPIQQHHLVVTGRQAAPRN